jgi:hypothetical protein
MSAKRFLEWGKGKPVLFVIVARQLAAGAEEVCELVNAVLSGKLLARLSPAPPAREMLRMYRRHKAVQKAWAEMMFGGAVGSGQEDAATWQGALDEVRKFDRLPENERRAILEAAVQDEAAMQEMVRMWVEFAAEQGQELVADLNGSGDQEAPGDDQLTRPEVQFYIRVWLPCMIAYGEYAPRLFARARRGNQQALDKLLRVDKSILADPLVADQFHQAHASGRFGALKGLAACIRNRGKPLKRRQAKLTVGAFISLLAKGMKIPITMPEIQELFDAVAEVKAKGEKIDTDLPEDPETFARETRMKRPKVRWVEAPGK